MLVPEEAEESIELISEESEDPLILDPEETLVVQEAPADIELAEVWEDTIPLPDLDILLEDVPSEWDAPADEPSLAARPSRAAAAMPTPTTRQAILRIFILTMC